MGSWSWLPGLLKSWPRFTSTLRPAAAAGHTRWGGPTWRLPFFLVFLFFTATVVRCRHANVVGAMHAQVPQLARQALARGAPVHGEELERHLRERGPSQPLATGPAGRAGTARHALHGTQLCLCSPNES